MNGKASLYPAGKRICFGRKCRPGILTILLANYGGTRIRKLGPTRPEWVCVVKCRCGCAGVECPVEMSAGRQCAGVCVGGCRRAEG